MSSRSSAVGEDRYDPLMTNIDTRQFYHPYAQESNFWANVSNRSFEILELVYFFFVDLIEGIFSFIARFICGMFY